MTSLIRFCVTVRIPSVAAHSATEVLTARGFEVGTERRAGEPTVDLMFLRVNSIIHADDFNDQQATKDEILLTLERAGITAELATATKLAAIEDGGRRRTERSGSKKRSAAES